MNQDLNNISILSVISYSGKNYGLRISSKCYENEKPITITITAYYLLKLLKNFEEISSSAIEKCMLKIEKGLFREGEVFSFPVPLKLRSDITLRVSKEANSKVKSNINSITNNFYIKGVAKKYVKVKNRDEINTMNELSSKDFPDLLIKSYQLYEDYKSKGFEDLFSRKSCGLDNDLLYELAKRYYEEKEQNGVNN